MRQIISIGEAIGDFVPRDNKGRYYEAVLGGSGFNAALALARFGAAAAYAGTLSTDALGQRFRSALSAEGIDSRLVRDSARPSAVAIVMPLGLGGEQRFGLYLHGTAQAEPGGTPRDCPSDIRHVHGTSFGATVGGSGEAALALMEHAVALGASLSYDINIRPSALPERTAATALIERRIALSTIVKASLDDIGWLHPGWPTERVVAHWHGLGTDLVLVTRGSQGACCHRRGGVLHAAAPKVNVIDTVGAGDTFIGGFLAMLAARGWLGSGLAQARPDDLQAALAFACEVAAESCTRPGCDPSRREAGAP